MAPGRIAVAVHVLDNADILRDHLEWYVALGVDVILANDFGSSDGSQDILEEFARRKLVKWSLHPDKNTKDYDPSAKLAEVARDDHGADWVIQCDTDEFLCVEGGRLREALDRAAGNELTVLSTRCFNMTGPPPGPGQSAPQALTLRIDRRIDESHEHRISGDLPVPYLFIQQPPKTIVRAQAFAEYAAGSHAATTKWGRHGDLPQLRFLHYPMRGFDAFRTKVRHAAEWFVENPHLQAYPEWGWHWRRWIRLEQEGRLREDYERQFVSPERAAELLADGTCTVDDTVASWLRNKRRSDRVPRRRLADIAAEMGRPHPSTKPRAIYERYDEYFAELADRPVTLLELGVHTGDSVKVFASFFTHGTIIGVDIEDRGVDLSGYPNAVFARGDQRSAEQIDVICAAHAPAGLDIVIDDASHHGAWSWRSYQALFPHLTPGALYVIEDWATGYWDDWLDGSRYQEFPFPPGDDHPAKRLPSHDFGMVGLVKRLVDEVVWHGIRPSLAAPCTQPRRLEWMHVHPEFVVLRKA